MKKRILSCLMALALCLSLMPTAVLADEMETMPAYSGGSGTEDNPWLISSVADLQLLANTINDGKAAGFDADAAAGGKGVAGNYYGYYFKQTTDLDLSDIANWDPIGYSGGQDLYFAGHYDGDDHTISNATCAGKNDDKGFATHLGLLSRKSLWAHFIKISYCVDRFLSTQFSFIKHNSLISQRLSFFFCGNCVLNSSFFPCIMITNPRSEDRGHRSEDLSVAKSSRCNST